MKLPHILAGPIVRRSTATEVNIWLASSQPLSLPQNEPSIELFDADSGYTPIAVVSQTATVQMGKNLFVHMLTALPKNEGDEFPTNRTIAYDIIDGFGKRLNDLMGLAGICLPGFHLPTFILSDQSISAIHALYGSCRKLHGPSIDMMEAIAHVLEKPPDGRPTYLFLGGDQIYADDVHENLFPIIYKLANHLIGRFEEIPRLSASILNPSVSRSILLDKVVISKGKPIFTSTDKDFHLLTFGEYAATYLLSWNIMLWHFIPHKIFDDGPATLVRAAVGARAARLALANTITYMIFDDHEITDDWFLNEKWRKNAESSQAAERIITNGLAAYWAFQGWGNSPSDFSKSFQELMSDFTLKGRQAEQAKGALLAPGRWSYIAPTSPPTLFLDTRTGRAKSPANVVDRFLTNVVGRWLDGLTRNSDAPRLLGDYERQRLRKLLAENTVKEEPLIVITPTPIFGFRPIEEMQALVGRASPPTGDLESWAANPRNLIDFIELILQSGGSPVVVLSGDVHYAFEIAVSVSTPSNTLQVAQFCSSAMKNQPEGGHLLGAEFLRRGGLNHSPTAWWDFRRGDDGSITRVFVKSPFYEPIVNQYGHPSFIIHEELLERNDQKIALKNNIGELKISSSVVGHRLWKADKDDFKPDEFLVWSTNVWPAPRVWP